MRVVISSDTVEKLETREAEVTLDFLIRSLLTLGTTVKELAEIMVHSHDEIFNLPDNADSV